MKLGIFAKTFEGTDPVTVLNAAAAAGRPDHLDDAQLCRQCEN